jgi:hypothetical protein
MNPYLLLNTCKGLQIQEVMNNDNQKTNGLVFLQ